MGGHAAIVFRISVSRSGRYAASAGNDGVAVVWDLDTNTEFCRLTHDHPVFEAGITAAADRVICAAGPKLTAWNLSRGTLLRARDPAVGWIRGLAVTADGVAVFGSDDGAVGTWDCRTDLLAVFDQRTGPVNAVTLLGEHEIATSTASTDSPLPSWVVVWDVANRVKAREWAFGGGVKNMSSALDGRLLLTAGGDGAVRIWDAGTGELQKTLQHHHW